MTAITPPPPANSPAPPHPACRCCGTALAGAFCSGCGQRADTRRLLLLAGVALAGFGVCWLPGLVGR